MIHALRISLNKLGPTVLALASLLPLRATENVLHNFGAPPLGAMPQGGVIRDGAGNLYGATFGGGTAGSGVVYKVNTSGQIIVLHSFTGGTDGKNPIGPLIRDSAGNLYGTTFYGGAHGAGVVYKLDPSGTETVLYTFTNGLDGGFPQGGVTRDAAGNLYGTTQYGGTSFGGVVFKIDTGGVQSVLYSFSRGVDGYFPIAGVILDSQGNLYGTTISGGASGWGVVYKVDSSGRQSVLYSFTGGNDGGYPSAGVVRDSAGNLYGTTTDGGTSGYGVVYKLDPTGHESVLLSFNVTNGASPDQGVVLDPAGRLYGATHGGGAYSSGVVYRLSPSGQDTVLHSFSGVPDGAIPKSAGVVLDSTGTLYGTTSDGGPANTGVVYKVDSSGNETVIASFPAGDGKKPFAGLVRDPSGNFYGTTSRGGAHDKGIVFKMSPAGQEIVLYSFAAAGGQPHAGLVRDSSGNLYGATYNGGASYAGSVFKLDADANETVLHSFTSGADGASPAGGLVLDSEGNLYGTTLFGGAYGSGTVFQLDPSGVLTTLYTFTGGVDGGLPYSGVTRDSAGNLYGTASAGGTGSVGVIYKIDTAGNQTVLHHFSGTDGSSPAGGVILDSVGNLYGTTESGGASGAGTIYQLDTTGVVTVLHSFNYTDGANPAASLLRDSDGNLYGTTSYGGIGAGTVFKLSAAGLLTILHNFTGGADGGNPYSSLVADSSGNLYGTTTAGGKRSTGVVFKIAAH